VEGSLQVRPSISASTGGNGVPLVSQRGYLDAAADGKAGNHAMTQFKLHFDVRGLETALPRSMADAIQGISGTSSIQFDSATGMPLSQQQPQPAT
jgi:hypothetical protein